MTDHTQAASATNGELTLQQVADRICGSSTMSPTEYRTFLNGDGVTMYPHQLVAFANLFASQPVAAAPAAQAATDERALFDQWMHESLFANPPRPVGPFDAWQARAALQKRPALAPIRISLINAGADCMGEEDCRAEGIHFGDYERGVADAIEACGNIVRKALAQQAEQRPAPAQAGLLDEILALAENGMSHGLLADTECGEIVAKIKAAQQAEAAPAPTALVKALRNLLMDVEARVLDGDAMRSARALLDDYDPDDEAVGQAEVAEPVAAEPFMFAIASPDGKPYFEEHCVDRTAEELEQVAQWASDYNGVKYSVVPVYLAAPEAQPSATAEPRVTPEMMASLDAANEQVKNAAAHRVERAERLGIAAPAPAQPAAAGELPELPEPTIEGSVMHAELKICYRAPVHFTADQMRAYARAAIAASRAQPAPLPTPEQLLGVARDTGLRSFLHGVNATEARELLAVYIDAVRQLDTNYLPGTGRVAQPAPTQAALDVLAERRRQVEQEGWHPDQDDDYEDGQLSMAAACYAMQGNSSNYGPPTDWPWDREWWKPSDDRRNLVKAGALILADIERLDRAAAQPQQGESNG